MRARTPRGGACHRLHPNCAPKWSAAAGPGASALAGRTLLAPEPSRAAPPGWVLGLERGRRGEVRFEAGSARPPWASRAPPSEGGLDAGRCSPRSGCDWGRGWRASGRRGLCRAGGVGAGLGEGEDLNLPKAGRALPMRETAWVRAGHRASRLESPGLRARLGSTGAPPSSPAGEN